MELSPLQGQCLPLVVLHRLLAWLKHASQFGQGLCSLSVSLTNCSEIYNSCCQIPVHLSVTFVFREVPSVEFQEMHCTIIRSDLSFWCMVSKDCYKHRLEILQHVLMRLLNIAMRLNYATPTRLITLCKPMSMSTWRQASSGFILLFSL